MTARRVSGAAAGSGRGGAAAGSRRGGAGLRRPLVALALALAAPAGATPADSPSPAAPAAAPPSLPARGSPEVRADPPAGAAVSARLTLSSFLLTEGDGAPAADRSASPVTLGHGDLRALVEARRLPGDLEGRLDLRLRLTSDFSRADAVAGRSQLTARGEAGGREYQLREAFFGWRRGPARLRLGRLVVPEADALVTDGAHAAWRVAPGWELALFGGLYPNPYSRSLPDDYLSAALAGAVGGGVAYAYPRLWGSLAFVGTIFGGPGGGRIDPAAPAAPPGRTEPARVYLATRHSLRAAAWLDLDGDLVLDVAGAAGMQVTRADLSGRAHLDRLQLRLGYGHLSSLAVEMYLLSLLGDRAAYLPGTIENNLVVLRTARDEGRLAVEVRPAARLWVYGEARVRRRALVDPVADPHFAAVEPRAGWDLTVGARDFGDLAGLRLGAALSEITDFRAETRLVSLDAGRDLWDGRLGLDLALLWEGTHDAGAGAPCPDPARTLAPGCYGTRNGQVWQGGMTIALQPAARLFVLADYRLVFDVTDGARTVTIHALFARVDLRL